MKKTLLSYSLINSIISCPHTYLNRLLGMKQITSSNMAKGIAAHDRIKNHLTGQAPHEKLTKLPDFPIVERESFDPQIKIIKDLGKYEVVGYVDFRTDDWKKVGDAKSGKKWSVGDFQRLMQWRVYSYLKPEIEKFYLVNVPFDQNAWNDTNVLIFNTDVTQSDRDKGKDFIDKGIYVIEHIKDQELKYEGHHPACWYADCSFCDSPIPSYRL